MSTENANPEEVATESAVSWAVAILDKKEPVRLTADLIRQESKVLTELTISSILDEKGYEAVKKAKNKAVKTRTAIEKVEKDVLGQIKARHTAEIKQVKDYAQELYTACIAVEKNLADKLAVIDTAKAEALAKEEAARKEKTEGRQKKMYELGMAFNGQLFFGYGKSVTPESLTGMNDERYAAWCQELAALQMEAGITGAAPAPAPPPVSASSNGGGWGTPAPAPPPVRTHPYADDKILLKQEIPGSGLWVYITIGPVNTPMEQLVLNRDINESGYFLQVTR